MRELAIQAANGTLNSGDRAVIDTEFQALATEIDRDGSQTTFNGVNLFDGSTTSLDLQVGAESGETISLSLENVTSTGLALSGATFDLTSASNASAALATIDTAIDSVSSFRGELGASQNRLQSTFRSLTATSESLSAAESRIRDVDVAKETADLTRKSILQQAALSVLGQANVQPQLALSLLG
jgi:flagellin